MKQKAALIFEEEETLVIKKSAYLTAGFCPVCKGEVHMLAPEVLAQMARSSEREVFRLIESGVLPFVETKRIYACLACYRRLMEQGLAEYGQDTESTAARDRKIEEKQDET